MRTCDRETYSDGRSRSILDRLRLNVAGWCSRRRMGPALDLELDLHPLCVTVGVPDIYEVARIQ